jgi:hypothetical protein
MIHHIVGIESTTALWLSYEKRNHRAYHPGYPGEVKGRAPSVLLREPAADGEAQRDAYRQPEHEDRKRLCPLRGGEEIAY